MLGWPTLCLFTIIFSSPASIVLGSRHAYTQFSRSLRHSQHKRETDLTAKRGIVYQNATWTTFFDEDASISWATNDLSLSGGMARYEYVPMLHNKLAATLEAWNSDVAIALDTGTTSLLSFNTPNNDFTSGGSSVDPIHAAALHLQYLQPYAGRVILGSPTPPQDIDAAPGLFWLSSFLSACIACTIDFVTIQWSFQSTNSTSSLLEMSQFLDSVHDVYKTPIWLISLDVSPNFTEPETLAMIEVIVPWLERQGYVHRYAWSCADLIDEYGLNNAGKLYQTLHP